MKINYGKLCMYFVAVALAFFISNPACAAGKQIKVKGSTTILSIAQATAEEFMGENNYITLSIQGGGSGVGIASLIDGACDIAISSRKIKDEEVKKAAVKGVKVNETPIAIDGIAVIIHPKNKVKELTKQQIKDIYTGKINDWSDVGGEKRKIVVVNRDSASGTFEAFNILALNMEKVRRDALQCASNQAVAMTISMTPGGIGYIGHGYLSNKVKDIGVNGLRPTRDNILTGKYPLSRVLYMYTNGKPQGGTKQFIDFMLGPQGKKHIVSEGFIPIK